MSAFRMLAATATLVCLMTSLSLGGAMAEAGGRADPVVPLAPAAEFAIEDGVAADTAHQLSLEAPYMQVWEGLNPLIGEEPGLGAVVISVDSAELIIYARLDWPEPLATRVSRVIDDAAADGILVRLIDVPYGEYELADIWTSIVDAAADRGVVVTGGGGHVMNNTVGFAGPDLLGNQMAIDILAELTQQFAGNRVSAVVEELDEKQIFTSDSRQDYGRPYRGGARISVEWDLDGNCTSGAGMQKTTGTARYLLTAAHCSSFVNGIDAYRQTDDTQIGVTQSIQNLYAANMLDASLIKLNGTFSGGVAYASNAIFTGASISSVTTRTVSGWSVIPRDTHFCVGGSYWGVDCNVVRPSGAWGDYAARPVTVAPNQTVQVNTVGVTAGVGTLSYVWGKGDSGGPLYNYRSDGNVDILGITEGATQDQVCGGRQICGADGLMTPISKIIDVLSPSDVELRTG